MKSRLSYILGIAAALVSIFLMLGIKLIFPACGMHDDGTYSSCHTASQVIWWMALAMAVIWILFTIINNRIISTVISGVSILAGIFCALIPGTIVNLCMMPTMRCQSTMKPFVIACGAVVAVLSIINLVICLKGREKHEK